eukprot:TRINITY_DN5466_c0_g3_i1.p1 TRINITY_DN5466_c0_g3~~TRINITY_DN5466_c0_g3_i1.p1  ORF type:complete len:961 (-),score=112.26 TRINITY_DN5466_c0_g3_i1:458-3340(-)
MNTAISLLLGYWLVLGCLLLRSHLPSRHWPLVRDPQDLEEATLVLRQIEEENFRQRRLAAGKEGGLQSSSQLLFEDIVASYGPPPRQNFVRYNRPRLGRRLQTLDASNTRPIRIHVNYDTLYEETVQADPIVRDRYCFRSGDWYRSGHPAGEKPSGAGPDDCAQDRMNKWCLCTLGDVIDNSTRALVMEATKLAVSELPSFLALQSIEGNLVFKSWEGSYAAMWKSTGQTGSRCDPDCVKGLHMVVPDSWCASGVAADVVLSVVMPPPLPGLGGAGTFCSADQNGRPLHLLFQWHRRPSQEERSSYSQTELARNFRGLVLHEVIHGLGFGTGLWQNCYASDGSKREVVKQVEVTDNDGTRDSILHFVSGTRTYEAAKDYFACTDDSQWDGLPLMSWPKSGRDTHHETRVLRDDVMSYGDELFAVSSITLATLEDTGHYLANYSNAECMSWGRGRGCQFVRSRCQNRLAGSLIVGAHTANQCNRKWSTEYTGANRGALEKCAPLECQSGIDGSGNSACYEECFAGQVGSCRQRPAGNVVAAGSPSWVSDTVNNFLNADPTGNAFSNFAVIALAPLCLLVVLAVLKCLTCPAYLPGNEIRFHCLTGVVVVYGGVMLGVFGWIFNNWSMMGALFHDQSLVICGMLLACILVFSAAFGVYGVCYRYGMLMLGYLFVSLGLLIFTISCVVMAIAASSELDGLVRDSLTKAGIGAREASSQAATTTYQKIAQSMSSLACNSYKMCCEDTALLNLRANNSASRSCTTAHTGIQQDVAVVLADPSNPDFCPYLTGLNSSVSGPSSLCGWIESTAGSEFVQQQCRSNYCVNGLRGFEQFLTSFIMLWTNNMRSIGLLVAFVITLQLTQIVNLCYIIKLSSTEAAVGPDLELEDPVPKSAGKRKKEKTPAKEKAPAKVRTVQVASAPSRGNRRRDDDSSSSSSEDHVPVVPTITKAMRGAKAKARKKNHR